MNGLTKWFLKQSRLKIFLLSFLGIPFYVWLFSIIYQLDKKRNKGENYLKNIIVGTITIYPIIYLSFYITTLFLAINAKLLGFIEVNMTFHLIAMFCGFLLFIIGANSYRKFEKAENYSTYGGIVVFFMLWFYVVGIWELQPNLNKYITE